MRKKQRCLGSLLMVLVMMFSMFPVTAGAADEVWIDISDVAGLKSIGSNPSANYRLKADIDLGGAEWNSIGPFSGKLDGNSKVIKNFTINDTSIYNKGLFSSVEPSGQISNLGIEGANITAGKYAGVLAGANSGVISKCYTKGSVNGYEYVGGLVGQNSGTIENSYSQASVSGKDYLGGLAGTNSGTVTKSYATSSILPSVFNNYVDFDGTSGYIDIEHKDIYVGDKFTLEAWFQWDKTNTDAVNFIMGKGYEQFEIHTGGGSGVNGLRFIPVSNEGQDSYIDVKNVIQPGWFHVAAVYSYDNTLHEATAQVYVNGKAQDLWRGTTNLGKSAKLTRTTNILGYGIVEGVLVPQQNHINIGRRTDETYYFDGRICDVRFWNIARTGDEINRDKDKVLTGNEPGLVGYWKLKEDLGEALDSSSSSTKNDGKLVGGVTRERENAATHKGGLIGQNSGAVSDSYYDSGVSGQLDAAGTPKSTEEMKLQSTFTDWDFSNVWGLDSGYPYLIKEISNATVSILVPATGGTPSTAAQVEANTRNANYTVSGLVWNEEMTQANRFNGGQVYTATITLTSKNGSKFQSAAFTPTVAGSTSVGAIVTKGNGVGNTVTFTVSFPVTDAKTLWSIYISTQPKKLFYTEGKDTSLSLDGMVVYEYYNDGSYKTVCFTDGTAQGYTTSPGNGTNLTAAHNNTAVTVTNTANGYTIQTNRLRVGNEAGSRVDLGKWTGSDAIIVPAGASVTITGNRNNTTIACCEGASLTLDNVSITNTTQGYSPVAFSGNDNKLIITGNNSLNAGSNAPGVEATDATLRILGTGSIASTGGVNGAPGIGSTSYKGSTNITIESGTIVATAQGEGRGSKFKGGEGIAAETITINGGIVTARGYRGGAGIGAGLSANNSKVTILGGNVTATGATAAPGIGSWNTRLVDKNNKICISGGRIVAIGGGSDGTGIGGSSMIANTGSIQLTGGEIFADRNSSYDSCDIGNTYLDATNWTLEIGGTAAVFLKNNKCVNLTTTTHENKIFDPGTVKVNGIDIPGNWTGSFGAYLLKPAPTNNNGTAPSVPTQPTDNAVEILVNGKTETAATATTTQEGNQTITTITVDDKKVEEKLQSEGNNATVTIPVKNDADVVVGQLNGQTVKNMETKEAVLEIKTDNVTYTLPASQINIDNVSEQIGQQVELKDIKVNVTISAPPVDTLKVVEDTANKNNYQVVVKPVEFNITCSSGNKTVEVSKFNGYVDRMVAIPDGIDPSKITTGIVLNSDGTFSHVPTVVTKISGKYYARINSLTNSTYSVIYSPKVFKDVENHWAKDAVNDMASRLIISGVGNDSFAPDRDITRAEFAAIIVRALGLMHPGTGKTSFSDVSKNDWYYDAVSIAYENGIISGYGNGKFGPTDKITNEQAMAMIANAMKITKLKADFKSGEVEQIIASYGDFKKASFWAKNSIALCIKTDVLSDGSGKLAAPKDNITRAEVAVIVQRLLQKSNLI